MVPGEEDELQAQGLQGRHRLLGLGPWGVKDGEGGEKPRSLHQVKGGVPLLGEGLRLLGEGDAEALHEGGASQVEAPAFHPALHPLPGQGPHLLRLGLG